MSAGAMWDDDTGGAFGHPALQNRATKTSEYRRADPLDDYREEQRRRRDRPRLPVNRYLAGAFERCGGEASGADHMRAASRPHAHVFRAGGLCGGAETTIEVSAKPTQAGEYKNAVIGGESTNPPVTVQIDVTGPKVQVRKTAHPAQMQIGESVVWTLSTKNEGNGATTQAITLTDTLPEHLSEIEVKPIAPTTCAPLQGRTLVCTVPAGLAAG